MRIAIMGSGGVGGYLGGRLAASGQAVTFIARGAHLDALRDHGLRIESALGDAEVQPARASDAPTSIGPVDLVIFAVKLYDTEVAAEACRPLVGETTGVVTFQNGIDSTAVLTRVVGREHVIGGVAQIASVVAAPGVIRHTGTMARFAFGELDGRSSARVEALAVARARGIALPEEFVAASLARTDQLPASMKSSMLEDLERGRRLELPWLSGAIVRMGTELGVPTPVHGFITTALKLHTAGRD